MKLRCNRSALASAFQIVSGVVPTRTSKDILRNVKLQLTDGKATLIATDHEIGVRYELGEVDSESAGEILLPTQRCIAILRELNDETVEIEATTETICIRTLHSEFDLGAEDPSAFPPVPEFQDDAYYTVPSKILKQMIRRTVFATDVESTRYALGGVLWDFDGDRLTMAATDSRRLSVVHAESTLQGELQDQNPQPVIPSKAMTLLERSLEDVDDPVYVVIHANDATIKTQSMTLYCRLVEGRFPRYRDVVPADSTYEVDLVVGPFYAAVRQSMIVITDDSRGVAFEFADGVLSLKSSSADVGKSRIELPISFDGSPVTTIFDSKFVADFLRVLEPESQVTVQLTDGDTAVAFRSDENYVYVVMPLANDK